MLSKKQFWLDNILYFCIVKLLFYVLLKLQKNGKEKSNKTGFEENRNCKS